VDELALFLADQADRMAPGASLLLRDVAYERIKDAIRHGALQPGVLLSETRLSQLMGISRTPVREALQNLAQEGLVQIIPGRAITVTAPSIDDALNAIQVRSILEPAVVRLSTDAIQPAQLDKLWQALQVMEEAVHPVSRDHQRRLPEPVAGRALAANSQPDVLCGHRHQDVARAAGRVHRRTPPHSRTHDRAQCAGRRAGHA
jgi:DNA-binding GntR family transcriptional regulator